MPSELASQVHEAGGKAYRVKKTGLDRYKPSQLPMQFLSPSPIVVSSDNSVTVHLVGVVSLSLPHKSVGVRGIIPC